MIISAVFGAHPRFFNLNNSRFRAAYNIVRSQPSIAYSGRVDSAILETARVIPLVPSVSSLLSSTLRIPTYLTQSLHSLGKPRKLELTCLCATEIEPRLTRNEPSSVSGELAFGCFGRRLPPRTTFLVPHFKTWIQEAQKTRMLLDADMQPIVDWFWTCAGKALGYRDDDALFSCEGTQIGHFRGDEIYGREGNYLGEIGRNGRLITNLNKTRWQRSGFFPERGKPRTTARCPTGEC